MAVTPRALIQPKFASTVMTAEYTAAEGRVILDKFTATNVGGGTGTGNRTLLPYGYAWVRVISSTEYTINGDLL